MYDVIIIGGGAAGIMASLTARKNNQKVLLIDKNKTLGRKITMTGNGRGNFTNLYLNKFDYNAPYFVEHALNLFSVEKTIDFFFNLGVPYVTEKEEGRCYPASEQATSLTEVLKAEIDRLGIDVISENEVISVQKDNSFTVELLNHQKFLSKHIIIATGGLTYPVTGSTGDGYRFAEAFNHTKTALYPALTRLTLEGNFKAVKGVRFTTTAHILSNNLVVDSFEGDIIFSDKGISGIASFALAKAVNLSLGANQKTEVLIELSKLTEKELHDRFNQINYKTTFDSLVGIVHKKLIPLVLKMASIHDFEKPVNKLKPNELNQLINTLKALKFKVISTDGFENAQITIGGINLDEIEPTTLESRLVKGLYFCGEVLNIDSKSGGFNLQWAWSSGYLAGLLL